MLIALLVYINFETLFEMLTFAVADTSKGCFLISLHLYPQAMSIRESGKASSSLGLQDFDLLRVIGRGSYAKVLLVRLKKTERIYAMKVVKKELVNDDEVGKVFSGSWAALPDSSCVPHEVGARSGLQHSVRILHVVSYTAL